MDKSKPVTVVYGFNVVDKFTYLGCPHSKSVCWLMMNSIEDAKSAFDKLCNKVYSREGVAWRGYGCSETTPTLHELDSEPEVLQRSTFWQITQNFLQSWKEGEVLQDIRDANVIPFYKNKGDRSNCNKNRGISPLNIIGNLFVRGVLKQLQVVAEFTQSPSVAPDLIAQQSTWYSLFDSHSWGVGRNKDHCTWPS